MPFDMQALFANPRARGALTGAAVGAGGLGLLGYLASNEKKRKRNALLGGLAGGMAGGVGGYALSGLPSLHRFTTGGSGSGPVHASPTAQIPAAEVRGGPGPETAPRSSEPPPPGAAISLWPYNVPASDAALRTRFDDRAFYAGQPGSSPDNPMPASYRPRPPFLPYHEVIQDFTPGRDR